MNKELVLNRIQCNICEDIITSRYRHDFQFCKCKKTFIDGGLDYRRIGGSDYLDSAIYTTDNLDTQVAFAEWGTYGKNGDEELHYIKIKDMTTEHLRAVISEQEGMNKNIRNLMFYELKKREI